MLWVCDQNNTGNSTAILTTAEQPLHSIKASTLTFQQSAGKGHLQDSWPKLFKGTFHAHQWGEDFRSGRYCLETGCAAAVLWSVVSYHLVTCVFGVGVFFNSFLCMLKFLHLDHWAFSLFLSCLPCLSVWEWTNQLYGAWLLSGVQSPHDEYK